MEGNNIFRGQTVEQAIESGLKQLGLTENEVTIEILDEGRKRIFKKRSKDAIVKIVKKDEPDNKELENKATSELHTFEHMEPEQSEVQHNGKVWVEQGEIHCIDPAEGALSIQVPEVLLLYKNNELAKGKVSISEKDDLRIEYKTDEVPTKWNIELKKDKLSAVIKVEPGYKSTYTLCDHKPAQQIKLEVKTTKVPNLTLTVEEISEKLRSLGIVEGIEKDVLHQACEAIEKAEFVIAKGVSPVEGKHGWVEYKVEMNEGKRYKEKKDGSIDYREGRDIPSVDAGIEIAIIHPPEEGTAGKAITGEVLVPKPVFPIQVKVGNGAEINEADIIVSTSIGRPSVQKRGSTIIIDVVSRFEHQGDVNLSSGNIKFNGDIIINGNVDEHMTLIASGNIEIKGTTSEAKIKAGQSIIHYSNVISSEIIAGNSDKVIVDKVTILTEILEELVGMKNDLNQISNSKSFDDTKIKDGIMPLLKVLIQTKYMPVISKIRQVIISLKSDIEMLNKDWQHILKQFHQIFIMMDMKVLQSLADFEQLIETLQNLIDIASVPPEIGAYVEFPSAMNCNIYSSGDVIVNKQGIYNCIIYAQGVLEVRGFIRGGRVFARQGANIDEAGSKGGTPTLIIAPHDQTITIKMVYADTIIQIGKKKYTFTKDMTNIVARIDEKGSIAIR